MINDYSVVDLFSGIGGLTHGLVKEGFIVDAGVDYDLSCKYAFEKNNKTNFVHQDLTKDDSSEIVNNLFKGKKKILVGCAPCQAFSSYNKNQKNDKWKLLYSYGEIIDNIKPEIISMENVPQLRTYKNGKVFSDFIAVLKKNDYHIFYKVVNSQYYGVPQSRKRLILLASKLGPIEIIPHTHNENNFVTVRKAIGKLPKIEDGISNKFDPVHRARKLSQINKIRIKATPEGGGWRDWVEELLLECHKKKSGKSFASVYGRMKWDDVAPTLTTQCTGYGNGRFGHPEQDRAISLREAALLQTFPMNYKLFDPKNEISTPNIERHIGNAVPVRLGQAIAKSIKRHIQSIEQQ